MKAIILAAGRGSRLQELTKHSPKCLVAVAGKPLLNYQLESLNQAGIKEIGIVTGYAKDKIQDSRLTTKFENSRWESTNMVYSLLSATSFLDTDTCIVSYSDIFYQSHIIKSLSLVPADIAISYDSRFKKLWEARFQNPLADLETFKINTDGELIEIGQKPLSYDEIQGQYMGLLKITPNGWQQIMAYLTTLPQQTIDKLDMTSLLRALILQGTSIKTIDYKGIWGEVDHQSDLSLYNTWAFNNF